jgi:hypothetical protein
LILSLKYWRESKMAVIVNRIFYIDVRHLTPEAIPPYMEEVKNKLYAEPSMVDDFRKMGNWEDIFIPVRHDSKVEFNRIDV